MADVDNTAVTEAALPAAAAFAAPWEGFRASPYQDAAGVWTIGYGSIHDALGNRVADHTLVITEPEARQLLARDMKSAAAAVAHEVRDVLTLNQAVALEDFVYNLGAGNLASSTLLADINAGNYEAAATEFDKWDHAGGKELAGLFRRRDAERQRFLLQ